eukprot:CAMPEP_0117448428 /NCGR_PEP_ID=MMETSP0759-20121206/7394_1 /TAXON_ID=63605 /ORGANISM="Percolomonas cosmopolitus, Strain WS" /LENGTH=591 /DNA_ID=CAMNT_0005240811 /DNA_START=95 /DNA_END=1870 /DNA_ORIENTATION=-
MSSLITTTENNDKALSTTGTARVNFFFKTVRGLERSALFRLLDASFEEDALDTIKLIFQLRDLRGEPGPDGKPTSSGGKGERRLFKQCLKYLAVNCPDILLVNLHLVPQYGRWDDLLELFYWSEHDNNDVEKGKVGPNKLGGSHVSSEFMDKLQNMTLNVDDSCPDPAMQRKIQDAILVLIKTQLEKDLLCMSENKPVSLCAKWLPSEGQHHDRRMKKLRRAKKTIKDKMAPRDSSVPRESHSLTKCIAEALGINKAGYRKKYISPLRKHLRLTESFMSAKEWDQIQYEKVPSQAMNRLKKAFEKNDKERFEEYQQKLQRGETKVNAKTLMAPQLVDKYICGSPEDAITEAQWKQLVEDTRELGTMDRALALCDVSGSMGGEPMQVSIALGILISEISQSFTNQVITFESTPHWFNISSGASLREKVQQLLGAPWGGSTNFLEAFRVILQKATELKVPPQQMPETLYVISDMQFDQADSSFNKSSFEVLQEEYAKAGYEVPRLVFWNVRSNTSSFPSSASEINVAMISGYSQGVLKAVLSAETSQFTPYGIMRAAIDDTRYERLTLPKEDSTGSMVAMAAPEPGDVMDVSQ